MRFLRTIFVCLITLVIFFGIYSQFVAAISYIWTQSNWSGGNGQTNWSDSAKFSISSDIEATASAVSLATSSGWFDSSWKYRQSLKVSNSGTAQTDFQVPLTINTSSLISSSKMKNDCSDLRLADATGSALTYWIATSPSSNTCNQTNTKIWVKLSTLPTSDSTIYYYYGNSGATSQSNGANVFPVFADFTTGSTLPNGWVKTDVGTAGTATVGSGQLTITNNYGVDIWENTYGGTHVYNNTKVSGSYVAETLITSQGNSDLWAKSGLMTVNNVAAAQGNGQAFIATTPGNGGIFQYQSLTGYIAANVNLQDGSFSFPMFLKLTKDSSNAVTGYLSFDGLDWTKQGDTTTPYGISNDQYLALFLTPHSATQIGSATFTFFYTHKYAATEPTVASTGTEQTPFLTSGSLTSSIYDTGQSSNFSVLSYDATVPANSTLSVKVRSSSSADMTGATDFSSCTSLTSGTDISDTSCVKDRDRYLQYQITLSSSDGIQTPSIKSLSIGYDPDLPAESSPIVVQSSTNPPSCSDTVPAKNPDLFQIDTSETQATLYFTPISEDNRYYLSYSKNSNAEDNGVEIVLGTEGVQSYIIKDLHPGTTYYFKVRGQHGCMPGGWSAIKSATTKSNIDTDFSSKISEIVETVLPPKTIDIMTANITDSSNICSYKVEKGDSLWTIAQNKLGDGRLFSSIKRLNNFSSGIISTGKDISIPCSGDTQIIDRAEIEATQSGIALAIKVETADKKPVVGASVTIHSKVQQAYTDADGYAHFSNVESGEHSVELAYGSYKGTQTLSLDGQSKAQTLTLTIKMNNGFSSPTVIITVSLLVIVIIVLAILLFKTMKSRSSSRLLK